MSTEIVHTPQAEGWQPGPDGKPPIPPGRTPEQVREEAERHTREVQAEQERRNREFARRQVEVTEANLRRIEELRSAERMRLTELSRRNIEGEVEKQPKTVDFPSATWTDPDDAKQAKRIEMWRDDLYEGHVAEIAAYTLNDSDIQNPAHRIPIQTFFRQIGGPAINLILSGGVGTGKTSCAIALGHACVQSRRFTRFISHAQYLRTLRPDGEPPRGLTKEQWRKQLVTADVLIIDDLGSDLALDVAAKEFVRRETLTLLGDRALDGRITVVTTNLDSATMRKVLDERITSRLGMSAMGVKFEGPDLRQPLDW